MEDRPGLGCTWPVHRECQSVRSNRHSHKRAPVDVNRGWRLFVCMFASCVCY